MAALSVLLAAGLALQAAMPLGLLQPPPPDPPVGRWLMWPVGSACHAKTVFAGGATLRVVFDRGRDTAYVAVWDPAWRSIEGGRRYRVTVRLGPFSQTSDDSLGTRYAAPAGQVEGLFVPVPGGGGRAFIDRLGDAPTLALQLGQTSLGAYPLAGIREVSADLVRCSEAADARVRAGTDLRSTGAIFQYGDYPAASRRAREQGMVLFRVGISAEGRVSNCTITASSGFPRLDEQACRLVRARARYHPPRDAAGNPAPSFDDARVTWLLPKR